MSHINVQDYRASFNKSPFILKIYFLRTDNYEIDLKNFVLNRTNPS